MHILVRDLPFNDHESYMMIFDELEFRQFDCLMCLHVSSCVLNPLFSDLLLFYSISAFDIN